MRKQLFHLFLCFLCFTQVAVASDFSSSPRKTSSSMKTKIGSDAWIEQKLRQYPELLWLTESSPSASFLSSPEGESFSQTLFDKQEPSFDIAIRSMIYLHLFVQGSRQAYAHFNHLQGGDSEISFKQFQFLHKQLTQFLNAPKTFDDALKILETAIVLKHIGASSQAVTIFKPYFTDPQLNSFYAKALHVLQTFPELLPSFARLSAEQKEAILSLRRLADYEELLNLTEAPSSRILSVGRTKRALVILDLYLFSLDTAGETCYSQDLFQNLQPLLSMLQQHATVEEAFSRYFAYRAHHLGLESITREDMTITRIATLMKLPPAEATILASEFKALSTEEMNVLVNHFYTAQGDHVALSIHGLPELIAGLAQASYNTTMNPEHKMRRVYATTLSFMVKSLQAHTDMSNKQIFQDQVVMDFSQTVASCGGIDLFSENIAVRIHLNGSVSVSL